MKMITFAIMIGLSSAEYIKTFIIDFFLKDNEDIIIGNEIMYGIEQKKVDLIFLKDRHIIAIEIKARNDSFKRLPHQLTEYQKLFSHIYLVITPNHLAKALSAVPDHIGLYLIEDEKIQLIRKAKLQKQNSKMDMLATINASFLKKHYPAYKKYDADRLRQVLLKLSTKTIQSLLYNFLEARITPRFETFLSEKGSVTHIDDIFLLSMPSKTII